MAHRSVEFYLASPRKFKHPIFYEEQTFTEHYCELATHYRKLEKLVAAWVKRTLTPSYDATRRRVDPWYRLRTNLRTQLYSALKHKRKTIRTMELCGCAIHELVAHLEKQFTPEMTWENYGPYWHVDHIRPCASFDLADEAQQRACFHYTNLQPLFWRDNISKGATWNP